MSEGRNIDNRRMEARLAEAARVFGGEKVTDYEDQKRLARDPDPAVRAALAADPEARPEILYFLAEDTDPEVRRQVAQNEGAPRQADLLLIDDCDDKIRTDLAAKIARLTPDVPPDRRTILYKLTVQALEALAEDQMVRVRAILSNALKDVAHAPPSVILTLAKDPELTVCSPVLEFSPVLSDKDLLEIIKSSPVQGAMNAIAKRKALKDSVSDAIARTGEEEAISHLLANDSAQIREDTLDFIIDRAPNHIVWHEPLVMRPKLSPRTVRRLASFVAMNLLDRMQKRLDLDDSTLVAVADAVETRLEADSKDKQEELDWVQKDDMDDRVNRLYREGSLNAGAVERALSQGEKRFVLKALAKMSDVSPTVVNNIITSRNPKAVVALAWKAGLRPQMAGQLQSQLVGLNPREILRTSGDKWPMSKGDMQWQLDYHAGLEKSA